MQTGEEGAPKPLDLFKTELANVLENNAAKLLENRGDKTESAANSKTSQRKSSQSSLARLFNSRSSSILTINSNKSDSTIKSVDSKSATGAQDNQKSSVEEVQVKRKEYVTPKSLSSSDSEDPDIQYSKLISRGKSRFFIPLPAMTQSREKTPEDSKSGAEVVAAVQDIKENADSGGHEFVRNVRGFGAQLRKSFFKRKPHRSEEKLGPLKQIRSDDDSSESEPEEVTIFMPQTPDRTSEVAAADNSSHPPHEDPQKPEDDPEVQPKKKKKSRIFSKKNSRKSSKSEPPTPDQSTDAEQSRGSVVLGKTTGDRGSNEGAKSKSNFYASGELIPNGTEQDADAQENGLRQYFEEALGTEDSTKTPKRRHLSWFGRKRKSEKPEVIVATKCSVDVGTQFPEVSYSEPDSRIRPLTNDDADASSGISQEMLWKVPQGVVEDKEERQSDPEMLFRCSSSHNEFPIHESDYVPGDSELTLSSLDVTDKANTVTAPTYYGSHPKPARIPIFSACCPAKATDLSVPYVKPNPKDNSTEKSTKHNRERDGREPNPAMAMVKTVAKQVVDKLREREKKRKKTETVFYPMTQSTARRWNSCMDLRKTSPVDRNPNQTDRRRSL